METFTLVRQEHLNHNGHLFGGQLLLWVDEHSWLVATRDFPLTKLVTRAMDDIEFKESVVCGTILRFKIDLIRRGVTSLGYRVEIFGKEPEAEKEKFIFATNVTFVGVNKAGEKTAIQS